MFGASAVVIIAGLRAAAPILTPLALAAFIAAVSLPALAWLRKRMPTALAILLIVLLDAVILASFGWIVIATALELRAALPEYIQRGQQLEAAIRGQLLEWGVALGPNYYAEFMQPQQFLDLLTKIALNATSFLAIIFLLVLYLVFILAESVSLPGKLRTVFGPATQQGEGLRGVAGVGAVLVQVERYLVLKTLISLATGIAVGVGAWLLGVDFALFWGFLAFVLNFVPNIGSVIAAIPAILIALLQLGAGSAIAMTAVFVGVNVTFGNLLEPILIGRHLRLSPVVTLVSLVFWGWTWGIVGMFLAVPLTIAMRIVMEHSPSLARFVPLLGTGEPSPARPKSA
jgi:predicted PurR-regulated permease PerM